MQILKEKIIEEINRLKPILRIADWEIDFEYISGLEMKEQTGDIEDIACCNRNRKLKYAKILFNADEEIENWKQVLFHELIHIVTDDFLYHVRCLLDFIPEDVYKTMNNQIDIFYERMVDDLAKGMLGLESLTKH